MSFNIFVNTRKKNCICLFGAKHEVDIWECLETLPPCIESCPFAFSNVYEGTIIKDSHSTELVCSKICKENQLNFAKVAELFWKVMFVRVVPLSLRVSLLDILG